MSPLICPTNMTDQYSIDASWLPPSSPRSASETLREIPQYGSTLVLGRILQPNQHVSRYADGFA